MRRSLLILAAIAAALVAAAPASAISRGRCMGGRTGPKCWFWSGKGARVLDGDTISVDVLGDGTSSPKKVRLSSIQAMEQSVYSKHPSQRRGECHALEATSRLEHMLNASHKRIRLSAQHKNAMSDRRERRTVWVRMNGHWQNVGKVLMGEGLTLWLPGLDEDVWNCGRVGEDPEPQLHRAAAARRLVDPRLVPAPAHLPAGH